MDDKDAILVDGAQAQITADRELLRSLNEQLLETQNAITRARRAYFESLELLRRLDDRS